MDMEAIKEKTGHESSPEAYAQVKAAGTWASGGIANYAGGLKDQPRLTSPTGRNKRSVFSLPVQYARLRDDLPRETKEKVVAELLRRGII